MVSRAVALDVGNEERDKVDQKQQTEKKDGPLCIGGLTPSDGFRPTTESIRRRALEFSPNPSQWIDTHPYDENGSIQSQQQQEGIEYVLGLDRYATKDLSLVHDFVETPHLTKERRKGRCEPNG
mmetsp:Transcript_8823/g.14846  ORF Transcript_8823/g.14846 Transcript_8823/m.14846 type:complete len:124 (-) Transcript_8823:620-991(-)